MKKERNMTIKLIKDNRINNRMLAEFFAKKYSEKYTNKQNKQN